jgi:poly(ADP-ribose) glycohydrolase ARH3
MPSSEQRNHRVELRVAGAIVGTALGDALGRPFEGHPSVPSAGFAGWSDDRRELTWTDDTAMTLALAQVLGRHGAEVTLDRIGDAFADAYAAEPFRGYGSGPPQVFAAARRGQAYEEVARSLFADRGSFGNGAAMRAAPAGCLYPGDPEAAFRLGRQQALVTHAHPVGRDAAGVVAALVATLADTRAPDLRERVGETFALLADRVAADLRAAIRRALDLDDHTPASIARQLGNGIAAIETVPAAIACLLGGAGDAVATVRTAVLLGGDTDTTAAVAGGLVGAAAGVDAWPATWRHRLEREDELLAAAMALAARSHRSGRGEL